MNKKGIQSLKGLPCYRSLALFKGLYRNTPRLLFAFNTVLYKPGYLVCFAKERCE